MSESIIPNLTKTRLSARLPFLQKIARQKILATLAKITEGQLTVEDEFGTDTFGQPGGLQATLRVHDTRFYSMSAYEGSVGAGEAYMRRYWSADDLTTLVRLFVRNREVLESVDGGASRIGKSILGFFHKLRQNSIEGSRRNIEAHYDLGNEFYELFLDKTMTYSSGFFESEEATLEEASIAKIDRLCQKLDLQPTDHVLEIGTGWGSFAIHAAREYGCRVTTTTISQEQFNYAVNAVREAGLQDRVEILFKDYRRLEGQYDKICSIEMIEAVGWQYYETFMEQCCKLLKPDGLCAMQAITIRDDVYESARRSVDFIQRYVFPGSCIPSTTALLQAATNVGDMKMVHFEDFAPHYARTLRMWRERFFQRLGEVRGLGFSEEFIRLWDYYLCYCEGGFLERNIAVTQMTFARPANRRDPILAEIR
ncbi:cyclopropane-fatty-acyl-phospholipid synthase family protein [bacterium]|nr:cyclopropane-fatty-acyl-phospholipid synthase family protein [bacterium]